MLISSDAQFVIKRSRSSHLDSQYLHDLPPFDLTFFQLFMSDHVLTSWMGQRGMRPTADPNAEVIVMEM